MKSLIITALDQKYGIPIAQVVHIFEPVKIESMPGLPDAISGVINFHGEMLRVLMLSKLMGKKESEVNLFDSVMLVCQVSLGRFVLLVDSVDSVEEISAPINSVKGSQVLLLDLNEVIDQEKLNA